MADGCLVEGLEGFFYMVLYLSGPSREESSHIAVPLICLKSAPCVISWKLLNGQMFSSAQPRL